MTCAAQISRHAGASADRAVAGLSRLGILGRQLGPATWEATLSSDQVSTGRLRIEDFADSSVISLAAPLAGVQSGPHLAWEILAGNAACGPGVRLGWGAGARAVLIGEAVLDNPSKIESRLERLIDDLIAFNTPSRDENVTPAVDLAGLCVEAGWEFTRRDESILVRLEADRRGTGKQAAAIPFSAAVVAERGLLRCTVELAGDETPPPEPNRSAVAALLLTTGARLKLVRPAVETVDERSVMRFESALLPTASAYELGQALSALSVAVRLCGPEASLVYRDANLAGEFLRILFPARVDAGIS